MIRFLIQYPIAVLMASTACLIVGLVTYFMLPVSLLPDVFIPEITVQVVAKNIPACELENTAAKPIRQRLIQVAALKNMPNGTRDGAGTIRSNLDFDTSMDLAFIGVNKEIDTTMNYLPKDTDRPKVIKVSITDAPMFYLNLTLKTGSAYKEIDQRAFLNLCEFSELVIKRRIKRLSEVTMVDVARLLGRQLQIVLDMGKLVMFELSIEDVKTAPAQNNVEPGSMTMRDGYYEYNIKSPTLPRTSENMENIYTRKGDRVIQLKEFCRIAAVPVKEKGVSVSNRRRAVTLAIIKQADKNIDKMKEALPETMDYFKKIYPDIESSVSRNQAELLDYTVSNLQQNLSFGFFFTCIVATLFLGDIKSPFIIGLSMVVSIVISFLFFYLCKMPLNIISLPRLILVLGMMIDSSIIVTRNISQYREKGYSPRRTCVVEAGGVAIPMLSPSFMTIAVFVPLVFMSDIAGAISYDRALAVTVGLMASYFTGITLLPVLYMLVYRAGIKGGPKWLRLKISNPLKEYTLDRFYDKGIDWVLNHKTLSILLCVIPFLLRIFFFFSIDKERMPDIDENELIARIEWSENIHVDENQYRVDELFHKLQGQSVEQTASVGLQDYILNREQELLSPEAELYFRTGTSEEIAPLQSETHKRLRKCCPLAVILFSPPETTFERLFVTGEADVVAELYARSKDRAPEPGTSRGLEWTFR